jgi:2,3-bisphosphoglycerate-dependent phosphoglycerate mutase
MLLQGVPLVYVLDENMKPIKQDGAIAPLSGRYLGDADEIAKRIGAVAKQATAK